MKEAKKKLEVDRQNTSVSASETDGQRKFRKDRGKRFRKRTEYDGSELVTIQTCKN